MMFFLCEFLASFWRVFKKFRLVFQLDTKAVLKTLEKLSRLIT